MTTQPDPELIRPEESQYLKVARSTMRYRRLLALAREHGCSWQEVARIAIDTYLTKNPPTKSS